MMRPITVELDPCAVPGLYFVIITGVYGKKNGLVVGNARPLNKAEKLKAAIEAQLRSFGQPPPVEGISSPPDIWDRLVQGDEF